MKKKLLFGGLGVVSLAGGFLVGSYVNGAADWKSALINQANSDLGKSAYQKKEELLSDPNAIVNGMKQVLNPEIKKQQDELNELLENYYQMKLKGLAGTDEYKRLEQQIEKIKMSIFERYRVEIDQAFSGQ